VKVVVVATIIIMVFAMFFLQLDDDKRVDSAACRRAVMPMKSEKFKPEVRNWRICGNKVRNSNHK
jgi:hypothetical protein